MYELCPCRKVYAATLTIAKNLKREITARTGHVNDCRYYVCEYGSWHWTSHVPTQFEMEEAS